MPLRPRRFTRSFPLVVLVALAAAPTALGQATRTWVSGTGDDANPCSRTAPCKTFPGSISKTASGGEINTIDSGGYGGVTIVKAITIDGTGVNAGILVVGTNGVTVNAGTNDRVILRHLNIDGLGQGLDGVDILQAKSVTIEDSRIYNFARAAVALRPSAGAMRVNIVNSELSNNGAGVFAAPNGGTGIAVLTGDQVDGNTCGAVAGSYGSDPSFDFTTLCGTLPSTSGTTGRGNISSFHTSFNNNGAAGVFSNGPRAANQISDDEVIGNVFGLQTTSTGQINSWANNFVYANGANGAPTGVFSTMARRWRGQARARH